MYHVIVHFLKDLQKVRKSQKILIRNKIAYVQA